MIFKKPDAFIVKHVRIIHAMILFGMIYLLFKTNDIGNVYSEVIRLKSIVGENYSGQIFNFYMYIILVFSLIFILLIMIILIKNKKKFIFYAIMSVLLIWMFLFYILTNSNILAMEKANISARVYLAYSDIAEILFYLQSVFVFALIFKTTGFNIKTFSFGLPVIDLEPDEIDDSEIEFNLEIDGNEIRTKRNRKIRMLKYTYLENRWKFNAAIVLVLALLIISIRGFVNSNKPVYYSLGDELNSYEYSVILDKAYVSLFDYSGKKIDENSSFVILKFRVKKSREQEYVFDGGNISVVVNDKTYFSNSKYFEYFSDFGVAYKEQKISQEYKNYYLVYQIPYEFSNKDILVKVVGNFNYSSNKYNYYEVKTSYEKIGADEKTKEFKLNNEMNIDAYGIKNKVLVSDYQFQDKFKLVSDVKTNEKSYKLVEYITPTAADDEEKAIMRLNYEDTYIDDENSINFAAILSKYATIEYDIGGAKKEAKIYSFIKPKFSKENNVQYIQVSKDALKGENRTIKIKIRDKVFKYELD